MTNYLELSTVLTPAQTPAELAEENTRGGTPKLILKLYYRKEGQRGLKLSITRSIVGDGFTSTMVFSPYNKTLHLLDMPRKNDKLGKVFAEIVEDHMNGISAIALASERPEWQEIFDLFASDMRAVA